MKFLAFSKVVTDVTSKFKKIKKSNYKPSGRFLIIDQGKDHIAGYTDDESLVNQKLSPIIIFGDHTRVFKYESSPIALGADGAKALLVNPNVAYDKYIFYFLKSINLKDAGYSRHFKFLKEVKIPIPYKDEQPAIDDQVRIAKLLDCVDSMIVKRKESLRLQDELLKGIFLEMFGNPVQNKKGWVRDRIGRSTEVQGGFAFKSKDLISKGTVRLVKIANVHFEVLIWDDISYVPDHFYDAYGKFALQEGDLLIALTRPIIKSLDVVKTATVRKSDLPCLLNQRVARFVINKDRINKKFLLQYCYTRFFKDTVKKLCPPGLQPNISTKQIEDIPIYYPPIGLQDQFAAISKKVEDIKFCYQQSLTELENLYGALSQKAFKGELDLSRIPIEQTSEQPIDAKYHDPEQPSISLSPLDRKVMADSAAREKLLRQIFKDYFTEHPRRTFSFSDFWNRVEFSVSDYMDDESPPLGPADYDKFKTWLFDLLKSGGAEQRFNEEKNKMELRTKP